MKGKRFVIKDKNNQDEHRIQYFANNGEQVIPVEGYKNKADALRLIEILKESYDAPVFDEDGNRLDVEQLSDLQRQIAAACEGLTYISETDAPVTLMTRRSLPLGKIQVIKFGEFCARQTKIEEWFGEEESQRAYRFGDLWMLLGTRLSNLTVLKIGEIKIRIFIFGADKDGNIVGVETRAIET